MKEEIQKAVELAIIEYLKSEGQKTNSYIEFKSNTIKEIASKVSTPIAERYEKIRNLNDTDNYLDAIDELIRDKNYTVQKAWEELEDNLAKYAQNPKYQSLQALFNARTKRHKIKFHNKNLKK